MRVGKRNGRALQKPRGAQRRGDTNGQARDSRLGGGSSGAKRSKAGAQVEVRDVELVDDEPDTPDEEDVAGEDFLLTKPAGARPVNRQDRDRDCDAPEDSGDTEWYESETFRRITLDGSEELPGNRKIATPLWVLHYFNDAERALLFGQLLYWFGRTKNGRRRASRREDGRSVIDKTHQELADEIGVRNKRRIEGHLKVFRKAGLLDHRTIGYAKGKMTRIRLLPDGVARAYREGSRRAEEIQDARHDKYGGS